MQSNQLHKVNQVLSFYLLQVQAPVQLAFPNYKSGTPGSRNAVFCDVFTYNSQKLVSIKSEVKYKHRSGIHPKTLSSHGRLTRLCFQLISLGEF